MRAGRTGPQHKGHRLGPRTAYRTAALREGQGKEIRPGRWKKHARPGAPWGWGRTPLPEDEPVDEAGPGAAPGRPQELDAQRAHRV
ncbi:unnamed protein product [Arctia plantaginis]|uniref:Uncharacterized protein n=1 Tax=Arctia plantaginis TaxID=874455 RepID=A0A8S1BS17_ARCPL|nr:unnamed protein product [Arctia plantaginis]